MNKKTCIHKLLGKVLIDGKSLRSRVQLLKLGEWQRAS